MLAVYFYCNQSILTDSHDVVIGSRILWSPSMEKFRYSEARVNLLVYVRHP